MLGNNNGMLEGKAVFWALPEWPAMSHFTHEEVLSGVMFAYAWEGSVMFCPTLQVIASCLAGAWVNSP